MEEYIILTNWLGLAPAMVDYIHNIFLINIHGNRGLYFLPEFTNVEDWVYRETFQILMVLVVCRRVELRWGEGRRGGDSSLIKDYAPHLHQ